MKKKNIKLLDRITTDPEICHGKPVIRGLRYPVEVILKLISSGMTTEEILADYEDLEPDDIQAVLAYAAQVEEDPILGLGSNPVSCGVPDVSENLDIYLNKMNQ